jgi:hypothetical protein
MKHVLLTLEWSRSRRRFSCAEVARCTNQIVGERCTFVVLDDQPFRDLVYLWSLLECTPNRGILDREGCPWLGRSNSLPSLCARRPIVYFNQ